MCFVVVINKLNAFSNLESDRHSVFTFSMGKNNDINKNRS